MAANLFKYIIVYISGGMSCRTLQKNRFPYLLTILGKKLQFFLRTFLFRAIIKPMLNLSPDTGFSRYS